MARKSRRSPSPVKREELVERHARRARRPRRRRRGGRGTRRPADERDLHAPPSGDSIAPLVEKMRAEPLAGDSRETSGSEELGVHRASPPARRRRPTPATAGREEERREQLAELVERAREERPHGAEEGVGLGAPPGPTAASQAPSTTRLRASACGAAPARRRRAPSAAPRPARSPARASICPSPARLLAAFWCRSFGAVAGLSHARTPAPAPPSTGSSSPKRAARSRKVNGQRRRRA